MVVPSLCNWSLSLSSSSFLWPRSRKHDVKTLEMINMSLQCAPFWVEWWPACPRPLCALSLGTYLDVRDLAAVLVMTSTGLITHCLRCLHSSRPHCTQDEAIKCLLQASAKGNALNLGQKNKPFDETGKQDQDDHATFALLPRTGNIITVGGGGGRR